MQTIGVGLIVTAFMGNAHAPAWRNVRAVSGDASADRLVQLADTPEEETKAMAAQFGFERATADRWDLLADPSIDVISVTAPNGLHREMAVAAVAASKHVWCEKPMALTKDDARAMETAARASDRKAQLGYKYLANPAITHAAHLLTDGAIGRLVHIHGWVAATPMTEASSNQSEIGASFHNEHVTISALPASKALRARPSEGADLLTSTPVRSAPAGPVAVPPCPAIAVGHHRC